MAVGVLTEEAAKDLENLVRVRQGLNRIGYDGVRMDCFNRAEAAWIWERLTPAERARTQLTWQFGGSEPLQP